MSKVSMTFGAERAFNRASRKYTWASAAGKSGGSHRAVLRGLGIGFSAVPALLFADLQMRRKRQRVIGHIAPFGDQPLRLGLSRQMPQ
jgi:hypothetical protein